MKQINIAINCKKKDSLNFSISNELLKKLSKILFYLNKILTQNCYKSLVKLILMSDNLSESEKQLLKKIAIGKNVNLRNYQEYEHFLEIKKALDDLILDKDNAISVFLSNIKLINETMFKRILNYKVLKKIGVNATILNALNHEKLISRIKQLQFKEYKKVLNEMIKKNQHRKHKLIINKKLCINIYFDKSVFDVNIPVNVDNSNYFNSMIKRLNKYEVYIENKKVKKDNILSDLSKYKKFFTFIFNVKFNKRLKEINYQSMNNIKIDNSLIIKTLNKVMLSRSLDIVFNAMNVSPYDFYIFFRYLKNKNNEINNILTMIALELSNKEEYYTNMFVKYNVNYYDLFDIICRKINFNNKEFIKHVFSRILKTNKDYEIKKYIFNNKVLSQSIIIKNLLSIF